MKSTIEPSLVATCPDSLLGEARLLDKEVRKLREKARRARMAGYAEAARKLDEQAQGCAERAAELRVQRLDIRQATHDSRVRLATVDGQTV